MADVDQPAPAQVPDVPPTAVEQAVSSQDVSAFRDARRAERSGTPLAPAPVVEPPAVPDPAAPVPAPEERHISKRQQQINDYERTIAELKAENARLTAPPPPAAPAPPATPKTETPAPVFSYPTFDQWSQKEGNGDRVFEEYMEERAVARFKHEQATEATKQRAESEKARGQAEVQRIATSWKTKVEAARTKHADFDQIALHAPTEIQPGSALDYWILESPEGAEVLYHLQQHPDEIRRIASLTPIAQTRELVKLEDSLRAPTPKHVSDAPEPPVRLGDRAAAASDPIDAAVKGRDMAAFKAEKLAQRIAAQRR